MAFIGNVLQEINKIRQKRVKTVLRKRDISPFKKQYKVLRKLLTQAANTKIGKDFHFQEIVKDKNICQTYSRRLPLFGYSDIYENYWKYSLQDMTDIAWPGKVKYFALTSGTSESASKRVPVTREMLKAIRKTSLRQSLSLRNVELPPKFYDKSVMMLGGSIDLNKVGSHYEGDLSGILIKTLPLWVHMFYKPGHEIAKIRDWNEKLDKITAKANQWDIAVMAGVPSWYQLLFDRMLEYYKVKNIHEIWPNLKIFLHGGVSFEPYRQSFEKYFAYPLIYLETYLASEGFFAYQEAGEDHMKFVWDNGIYFEFIPFNEDNFDEDGNVKSNAVALNISQVQTGVDYALVISTCAGAWRYLIGDTVRLIDLQKGWMKITGRTKMFLSICGEHLSVDNMNEAVQRTSRELGITINEYTVYASSIGAFFKHHWFLGIRENSYPDKQVIIQTIDKHLKTLNDDYATERKAALKELEVDVLPLSWFYDWMKSIGKFGAQNKFPRVMKGERLQNWLNFVESRKKGHV
ncbi:MAG: hypothetical protein KatS3mg034_0752 [Vicingaceae bacterium]|nr:MAG: hypothetical protein KatS3mg034_0752 [Vicingaceae bacterium]